ncbi:MAG TPA: DUF711 family protein [Planctomycetota bacterium]|nr:DUF711 family protein [Planctomycetota bacterium]
MRIRSVTVFATAHELAKAGTLARAAAARLRDSGYTVQTVRGAVPPVPRWLSDRTPRAFLEQARELDQKASDAGLEYLSIGPLVTGRNPECDLLPALPDALAMTQRIFANAFIGGRQGGVLGTVLSQVAEAILGISRQPASGFNNVRFAALANCGAGIPFFPAAYAPADGLSFALAMEAADMAVEACGSAQSYGDAAARLSKLIQYHAGRIEPLMDAVGRENGAQFLGCDWSLAPHPDEGCSTVAAIESLTGAPLGSEGTLTAVATLTRAIQSAPARHVGFSGVFLPVLEDSVLAKRVAEGRISLQDLMLYSAVCGTGLDTIPLPGDVSNEAIAALLGDVAALAASAGKPLTVRVMPVPGLSAGEKTRFDFPYFVNTSVMRLDTTARAPVKDERLSVGRVPSDPKRANDADAT